MPTSHDLAIRWNNKNSSVDKLKRSGGVPIYAFPHHFRCPGGRVVIVSRDNEIKLMFKAIAIEGPQKVTLADGKRWPKGYIIRPDRRTMRRPSRSVKSPFKGFYAIGAFRYLNAAKMQARLVSDNFGSASGYVDGSTSKASGMVFRTHVRGIPGLPRMHPESILVDEYTSWLNKDVRFGHNYIREAKLYVDLFDLTHWQLLEAKATISREAIRMAIGQLMDYKRFYHGRRPSLAVLLSSRPPVSFIKLLSDSRIATIWKTPSGRFRTNRWQQQDE